MTPYPVSRDIGTHSKDEAMQGIASLSSLPSYNEAMQKNINNKERIINQDKKDKTQRKKIIPVVSESSESSQSSEEPYTPLDSPQLSSISSRFRMSQRSNHSVQAEDNIHTLGQKLKNNYSFREKRDSKFNRR